MHPVQNWSLETPQEPSSRRFCAIERGPVPVAAPSVPLTRPSVALTGPPLIGWTYEPYLKLGPTCNSYASSWPLSGGGGGVSSSSMVGVGLGPRTSFSPAWMFAVHSCQWASELEAAPSGLLALGAWLPMVGHSPQASMHRSTACL